MTDQKSTETVQEKKDPSLGDRAKDVIKDEAARAARWEARSLVYRIFGNNLGRMIRRIFGS
ncbi:hypothetical protein ACFL6C_11480 [Myxococcota bacterium]